MQSVQVGGPHPIALSVECTVTNVGKYDGDEVVLAFHSAGADVRAKASALHPVPRKALVGFERVRVAKGASARVRFDFGAAALELVNATGGRQLYAGTHELIFSRGHGREERVEVKL